MLDRRGFSAACLRVAGTVTISAALAVGGLAAPAWAQTTPAPPGTTAPAAPGATSPADPTPSTAPAPPPPLFPGFPFPGLPLPGFPAPAAPAPSAPEPVDPTVPGGQEAPAEELPPQPAPLAPDELPVPAAPVITPADLAEVAEISRRLTELDALTTTLLGQVAAAQDRLDARRAEVVSAAAAADAASLAAREARTAAETSRTRVDTLVSATYDGSGTDQFLAAVLTASGPRDLLDRVTGIDVISRDAARALTDTRTALEVADRADVEARAALDTATAAEAEAAQAQAAVVARRSELTARTAEVSLLVARVQAGAAAGLLGDLDTGPLTGQLAVVGRVRDAASGRPLYVLPTTGVYTSGFGQRWGAAHQGVDLANAVGTPVVAVADGVVIDAGPAAGFGQWVRLRHADGTITVYGHVESFLVARGQSVLAGQLIATMGNRGQSTGPHLHFEVVPPGGAHVDPVAWFAARSIVLR